VPHLGRFSYWAVEDSANGPIPRSTQSESSGALSLKPAIWLGVLRPQPIFRRSQVSIVPHFRSDAVLPRCPPNVRIAGRKQTSASHHHRSQKCHKPPSSGHAIRLCEWRRRAMVRSVAFDISTRSVVAPFNYTPRA
jgi:hypothetical protein